MVFSRLSNPHFSQALLGESERLCPCCGKPYLEIGSTEDSETLEVEVQAHRRRICRKICIPELEVLQIQMVCYFESMLTMLSSFKTWSLTRISHKIVREIEQDVFRNFKEILQGMFINISN